MIFEWFVLAVVLLASTSIVYFTLRTGISPMPSNGGSARRSSRRR